MKYCYNCGNKINSGDKVCSSCGTEFTPEEIEVKDAKIVEEKEEKVEKIEKKESYEEKNSDGSVKGSYYNENVKTSHVVNNSETDTNEPTILCIVSLICTFVLTPLLPIIKGIPALVGLGLMIFVRIAYPKNTFGKVLMWLYIVMYALVIIGIVILLIACGKVCGDLMRDIPR